MIARRSARLLAGAAALLALAGAAAAPPPKSTVVGSVAALRNQVNVRPAKAPAPRPAVLRQRVGLGDQVQTGEGSHMQLLLLDRSSFTVGQNARVTIDRFVYDPAGGSFSATVAKGALRFMSGGAHGKGGASIRTPVATIGIRGTIVDTVVGEEAIAIARREPALGSQVGGDPQTASLIVLRGPGPRDSRPGAISVGAAGETVDLDRPLLAVYVPGPNQPPIGPFTISLPGLATLNDLVLPRLDPVLSDPRDLRDIAPLRGDPYPPFSGRPLPRGFSPGGEGDGRVPVPDIPLRFPQDSGASGPSANQASSQPPPSPSPSPPPAPAPTGGPSTGPYN